MLTEESVLEFCSAQFKRELPLTQGVVPEPRRNMKSLKAQPREWLSMQLNEFRPAADIPDKFVGTLTAQRSDGQWFYVFLVFSKGDIVSAPDPVVLVQEKLRQGRAKLDTFRDCSCGIIGYRKTGEVDDEGDPIEEAVHSPCATHHKGVRI